MNSPGEEKDELGAHDTCGLGFEFQGNEERKNVSSGEVGLHEEKKVACRKRMKRTRWPQVRLHGTHLIT